jgi:glutathione S-transferase
MAAPRTLHHFPLDPASRLARLVLGEKRLDFEEALIRYWEPDPSFEALSPSGLTPVLVEKTDRGQIKLCESGAILGFLEETFPDPPLLAKEAAERAEARRLLQWFERKYDYEVNALLLHEKMEKRLLRLGAPDLQVMRRGREAMRHHFTYFESLLQNREWLAGRRLSLADFAAAAHVSVLDYFGEAPWPDFPAMKTWYMKIKSRPCFRPLLADRQPGAPPAAHYDDLDF